MLDGGNFLKAGWVHRMKLHKFDCSLGSERFLVMGKVISNCNINHYELSFFNKKKGKALPENVSYSTPSVDNTGAKWRNFSFPLYLYGRVKK